MQQNDIIAIIVLGILIALALVAFGINYCLGNSGDNNSDAVGGGTDG